MSTETSYYFHSGTAYRRIENMSPTNSGALAKRAGTRLLLTDTREVYVFSARDAKLNRDELYVFFSDNKYLVLNLDDFSGLLPETPNPANLLFNDIKNALIYETPLPTTGETRILIPTPTGIFYSDLGYIFSTTAITGLPPNTPTNLFILAPGRGIIANSSTLYFSAYNNPNNYTPLVNPSAPDAPTQGYVLNFVSGLDGDIVDLIFYKNSIFIGTTSAIYRLEYNPLNPFADVVVKNNSAQRVEKIYHVGISFRTFADIGDFVVFANDRGIYGIEVSGAISSNYENSRIYVTEFTYSQEHVTSEDNQIILDIASYYARDNVFFSLRNDCTIFKCAITKNGEQRVPFFTRYIAGISQDQRREYIAIDHVARAFVTKWGDRYFVELNRNFPYLNDNKLVFSWHDTLKTIRDFAFLDCFQDTSELKFLHIVSNNPSNTFKAELNTFFVGESYYYWDLIEDKYDIFSVASVNKKIITITKTVQDILVLGIVKTEQDLDILLLKEISGDSELYVTYADVNHFPFRMNTVMYSPDIKFSSFFLIAGFPYSGTVELSIYNQDMLQNNKPKVDTPHPLLVNYFACEQMEMTAFSKEGTSRTNKINRPYRHVMETIEMPTVEWKYYGYANITIPAGFSGVFIQISFL